MGVRGLKKNKWGPAIGTFTNHWETLLMVPFSRYFRSYCIAIFCFYCFPMVFFSWLSQSNWWPIINPCTLPASWEICIQVKNQLIKLDVKQQTGSKLGKEYVKAVYFHPAYLNFIQSTSWEMLGWIKHKLESRFPGKISITSDTQMVPPLMKNVKRNWRASWWKWKRSV